jgi:hypothetical protein
MDQIISRTSMDEDEDAARATLLWREGVAATRFPVGGSPKKRELTGGDVVRE